MKVLIIGGTQFIGRHVVEKLLAEGHDLTLLNRGKTNPGLFSGVPVIIADRQSPDLKSAKDLQKNWDAVIDLSAYYPKDVSEVLHILSGFTGRYVFCSTISVYSDLALNGPSPLLKEESPLLSCNATEASDTTMLTYGKRKAECERVIASHPSKIPYSIIRPSVVFGAHDHTDRFAYWIARAASEKNFILPDDGLTTTQKTYAPDLAQAFASCMTSASAVGNSYNIAETETFSLRNTVAAIGKHLNLSPLNLAVPVATEWLLKNDVIPWANLPLWIPRTNLTIDTFKSRKDLGFVSTSPERALAEATDSFLSEKRQLRTGLSFELEESLISKWLKLL